jgi:GTP-binding protein
MIIHSAEFTISSPSIALCPKTRMPEFAFIGRSNVGKSSLINMLVNRTGLAKTSVKPGKTRLINHFLINKEWFLVDLPGYGYAGVSKNDRKKWADFIDEYLMKRENLSCIFVLIDVRLEPQKIDIEFINNLGEFGVPFVIVFTKADKVSMTQAEKSMSAFRKEMKKFWEELPQDFLTSSSTKLGREGILDLIEKTKKELQSS